MQSIGGLIGGRGNNKYKGDCDEANNYLSEYDYIFFRDGHGRYA